MEMGRIIIKYSPFKGSEEMNEKGKLQNIKEKEHLIMKFIESCGSYLKLSNLQASNERYDTIFFNNNTKNTADNIAEAVFNLGDCVEIKEELEGYTVLAGKVLFFIMSDGKIYHLIDFEIGVVEDGSQFKGALHSLIERVEIAKEEVINSEKEQLEESITSLLESLIRDRAIKYYEKEINNALDAGDKELFLRLTDEFKQMRL